MKLRPLGGKKQGQITCTFGDLLCLLHFWTNFNSKFCYWKGGRICFEVLKILYILDTV